MNVNKELKLAFEHHQAGNLKQAQLVYSKILRKHPNNFDALHMLGVLYAQLDSRDLAINYIEKALQINPNSAHANFNLGNALKEKGELDKAIFFYRKSLQLNGTNIDALYNLGVAFQKKALFDDAINSYQKVLLLNSGHAGACYNIGIILESKGQLNKALSLFQKVIKLTPNYVDAYYHLGHILSYQGKLNEALTAYDAVLNYKPNYFPAHWAKCMAQLPIVYSNQQNIQVCRENYFNSLIKLRDLSSGLTLKDIDEAIGVIAQHIPFYLAYQCLNDKELQRIYGEIVCRIMHTKYPELAGYPDIPQYTYEKPLRIGIVSGFFNYHSNWKIPIKGWVENLDRVRFKLYGYYTGLTKEQETAVARKCFDRFTEDILNFDTLCQIIKNDRLHVLIYPEIGMDALTLKLAALRLAPIQCTSWGHPHTSGFRTIDYFLSSELMEPPDADNHYTEKLIRLPNLSIYYTAPEVQRVVTSRETFGLSQNSVIYLCPQSLYKYLPQYDEIYPRIARRVDGCRFIFLFSHLSQWVTEQFRSRMKKAFDKFSLMADVYVVILPRLEKEQYCSINSIADVFLDSIEWSGCNSTLEALACNLPVITLPGELMRGRHSSAILTMMGMTETIVSTVDEYVQLAVRLGLDTDFRKHISKKVAANKHLVYDDQIPIAALEAFLEKVVEEGKG